MYKKIVTHAGTFHADELCAIAHILRIYPNLEIERTFTPSQEDMNDPDVIVLDIGRVYDAEKANFDHHQDGSLPASNLLVAKHILRADDIPVMRILNEKFMRYISDVDTGVILKKPGDAPTISHIIAAFNSIDAPNAFDMALNVMSAALEAQFASAHKQVRGEQLWQAAEKRGKVAVHDSTEYIVDWGVLAEKEGINYLVTPNQRGGYQIASRDSQQFPIPPDPRQTFRHNSGFIAAYATVEDAIEHAMSL